MIAGRTPGRLVLGLAAAHIAGSPGAALAQQSLTLRPSLSVTEVYESNLFSTGSDPQADFITRITPGLESGFRSALWTLSGRYALDVERFATHRELTAADARQESALALAYRPSPRTTVAAGAEFLTTRTPRELNVTSGLTLTRARASRFGAHSAVTRQVSPVTSGSLEYAFTQDRLGRSFETFTHAVSAGVERRLSPRTDVTGRYRLHNFAFTTPTMPTTSVTSHSVGAGWTRAITRGVAIAIEAGPRLTGDALYPEAAASIAWNTPAFDLSLAYARTQTTVIGLVGAAHIQTLQATVERLVGRSLELRFVPGVFRSQLGDLHADVYLLSVGLVAPIARTLALDVTFDGALQRGSLYVGTPADRISRHTVAIRLVAAPDVRKH